MRPCPECGEAREAAILNMGDQQAGCGNCGTVYDVDATVPEAAALVTPLGPVEVKVRPGVRVITRGTSGGRKPSGGCLR